MVRRPPLSITVRSVCGSVPGCPYRNAHVVIAGHLSFAGPAVVSALVGARFHAPAASVGRGGCRGRCSAGPGLVLAATGSGRFGAGDGLVHSGHLCDSSPAHLDIELPHARTTGPDALARRR